ncbi:MAG: TetR/AcrR family transcriptional regulator [Chitinophagaceae bacterium]|nr:TetR/AcrR family transcriptional regulator [Chitinophagaceae bacterium]
MQQLITDNAEKLFYRYGIKAVAMDDLARTCGISKKTLYQYFADKATLVNTVVERLADHHRAQLEEVKLADKNAIEQACCEFKIYVAVLHTIHAVFFYELEKLFPDSWNLLIRLNNQYSYPFVVRNLERGMSEGYYRPELDIAATAAIRMAQLKLLITRNIYVETGNLLNDPDQINLFYLHAITNSKGKKIIDKILDKNNENREEHLLSV